MYSTQVDRAIQCPSNFNRTAELVEYQQDCSDNAAKLGENMQILRITKWESFVNVCGEINRAAIRLEQVILKYAMRSTTEQSDQVFNILRLFSLQFLVVSPSCGHGPRGLELIDPASLIVMAQRFSSRISSVSSDGHIQINSLAPPNITSNILLVSYKCIYKCTDHFNRFVSLLTQQYYDYHEASLFKFV